MRSQWLAGIFLVALTSGVAGALSLHASQPARVKAAPPPQTIIRMHHVDVTAPRPIENRQALVNDNRHANHPAYDDRGNKLTQREIISPPQRTGFVQNTSFVQKITSQQTNETTQNQYYWHHHGNLTYVHYHDSNATDWYGFYNGPTFYWTRYHAGRWWWFDHQVGRWVFWGEGFWWWPMATGELYVYVDNNYYPYEEEQGGVTVVQTETVQTPGTIPPLDEGKVFQSPDGKRVVQVSEAGAFLYDITGAQPVFKRYLGPNVAKVIYASRSSGKPLEILVNYQDGSYALFDADGNPLQTPVTPATAEEYPDESTDMPPVPEGPGDDTDDDED